MITTFNESHCACIALILVATGTLISMLYIDVVRFVFPLQIPFYHLPSTQTCAPENPRTRRRIRTLAPAPALVHGHRSGVRQAYIFSRNPGRISAVRKLVSLRTTFFVRCHFCFANVHSGFRVSGFGNTHVSILRAVVSARAGRGASPRII